MLIQNNPVLLQPQAKKQKVARLSLWAHN